MSLSPSTSSIDAKPLTEQCADLCDHCLALLDSTEALDDEHTVHELRVTTKRLRAAWLLVSGAHPKIAKRRRKALRKLSAKVADRRDRSVLQDLAAQLGNENDTHPEDAAAFATLADTLSLPDSPLDACTESILHELIRQWRDEKHAWLALKLGDRHSRRKLFRKALRHSNKLAAACTRKAHADHHAEVWHDWRKAVKRVRYQREFVAASQGREPGKRDARISRLGTRLGERNDLDNLAATAEKLEPHGKAQRRRIRKAIAHRERHVMRSARRLGRLAFLR